MRFLFVVVLVVSASAAEESAEQIMTRVAANQDRAQAVRESMVYEQDVLIRLQRGNKKLAREESYQFIVTPTKDGVTKERKAFSGRYESKGQFYSYDKPGFEYKDVDIDGDLAHDLVEDLTNDKSRDGIAADLFPLRASEIDKYRFRNKGRQQYRGHEVWVIAFEPKKKTFDEDGSRIWAGEALIDAAEYQPVLISTWMAKGLPLAVKTLLGTDLKQMGFKVAYERFDNDVWMPVSYGGELYLRAVFVYKRYISLSLRNSGFRRARVESTVSYDLNQ